MGQRSLLYHPPTSECPYFCISSVPFSDYSLQIIENNLSVSKENNKDSEGTEEEEKENTTICSPWTELPTNALFSLKVVDITESTVSITIDNHQYGKEDEYLPFGRRTIVSPDVDCKLDSVEDLYVKGLLDVLYNSVKVRVLNLPIAKE